MRSAQADASGESEESKKSPPSMDAALDRAGDERFFGLREFGIAEGNDNSLTRQTITIAIGLNESRVFN